MPAPEPTSADSASGRLLSIDALRGFDMLWIIGGKEVLRALAEWGEWPTRAVIKEQTDHVEWEGFHFEDLIFPLFLFLVGVVLPFSLGKLLKPGASPAAAYWRVIRRTALLVILGLLYNHVMRFDWETQRWPGVLQRIGICYGIAGLIVLSTGVRLQAVLFAAILAGYWAILTFVAPPGGVAGDLSKKGNLAGWIDRWFLPGKIYQAYYGDGDNEGILSTLPAVATTLLGVLAGHWLRSGFGAVIKTLGLALAGSACLAGGYYWAATFPIIKNLWTSSFVLFAGGWSLLLLALFYGVIDGLKWRTWSFFFVVIGANAILIYIAPTFIDFEKAADVLFGGVAKYSGSFKPVLEAAAVLAVKWVLLLWLYRNKLFLRV